MNTGHKRECCFPTVFLKLDFGLSTMVCMLISKYTHLNFLVHLGFHVT